MVTKKKTTAKAAPKKRVVKKTVKKKTSIKKSPVKKAVVKKTAKAKPQLPPYHLNRKEWDRLAVMEVICDRLVSTSQGLAYICRDDESLPKVGVVFRWISEEIQAGGDKPIYDMYASAKDIQIDYMADETIEIGDNEASTPIMIGEPGSQIPLVIGGKVMTTVTSASVQHAKLRSDNRKWVASKLKPRKYGDRLELSGDPERPLQGISDEDLDARIAVLKKQLDSL